MLELRVIADSPADGPWNMAADEVLLHDAADNGTASLRFYHWSEPTLSLGYFQRACDRNQHAASRDGAVVRRQTGGGAILHDRELTYSLALPANHPLARTPIKLYEAVHDAFVATLRPWLEGVDPSWRLQRLTDDAAIIAGNDPFLCFQRRSRGDVLLEAPADVAPECQSEPAAGLRSKFKLIGSAQRRYRGALLQHGSFLRERSPYAPELAGWRDLVATYPPTDHLISVLVEKISAALCGEPLLASFPPKLECDAHRLANSKYARPEWLNRR